MSSPGRRRLRILLAELTLFMLFAFWLFHRSRDGWPIDMGPSEWRGIVGRATLGVIAGPMAGAMVRPGERGAVELSVSLLPAYGAILASGILLQLVPLPARPTVSALRTVAWALGWLAWFLGGVHSLLYHLE